MLNEEIMELRRKLNDSVKNKDDYKKTYELSVELDKLIAMYYNKNTNNDIKYDKNCNKKK